VGRRSRYVRSAVLAERLRGRSIHADASCLHAERQVADSGRRFFWSALTRGNWKIHGGGERPRGQSQPIAGP